MRRAARAVSEALDYASRGVVRAFVCVAILGAVTVAAVLGGAGFAGPLALVFLGIALLATAIAIVILRRLQLVDQLLGLDMSMARLATLTRGFDTERLSVRLAGHHAPESIEAMIDAEFMHQNGWAPDHRSQLLEMMRRPRWVLVEHGYLLARERGSGDMVGMVTFSKFDRRSSRCELGWFVAPDSRGRGFGLELLEASVAELHSLGIAVVVIVTRASNVKVQRCMDRIGGVLVDKRPADMPDGSVVELLWYEHRDGR